MDKIQIFDDFFTEEELNKILDFFDNAKWNCLCHTRPNVDITTDKPFWRYELENEPLFAEYLNEVVAKKIFKKKNKLDRMYSVGQMYGQDSNYHPDNSSENTYTFCFYINTERVVEEDAGGYFFLKVPGNNYKVAIDPKMNRGVLFPSRYYHKGTGFNILNSKFRICIAWKFEII